MISKLLVFSCMVAFTLADDVIDAGDDDFVSQLSKYDTALVMFYAPWCGHCKKLKPEFEKAASSLLENDPPVALIKVDCTENGKDTCSKFGVSGYPTLKIFRGGEINTDYNGPRDASGIVKFMRSQVGPASKELLSIEAATEFLAKAEVAVVYFGSASGKYHDSFTKSAEKLRESVRFGYSLDEGVNKANGYDDAIVLFRPSRMANKFEPNNVVYDGPADKKEIENFIKVEFHGLVGYRTQDTSQDFLNPLVVSYFNVDYVKNIKGTNYWRNRILKVAQSFKKDFNFAISGKDDFQHELNEYGLDYIPGDKPKVCARDAQGSKFIMTDDFTVESFEAFLKKLRDGELEPYLKSEAIPDQTGPVTIAVAKNFDEVITNNKKDVLVEFYAPWCGHCKKLTPIYDELGEKMAGENVEIVKMDATANDVPSDYNVRGFPTIFWKPAGGKPESYNGGRELTDFLSFISKQATNELDGYDRNGKEKQKKTEL